MFLSMFFIAYFKTRKNVYPIHLLQIMFYIYNVNYSVQSRPIIWVDFKIFAQKFSV